MRNDARPGGSEVSHVDRLSRRSTIPRKCRVSSGRTESSKFETNLVLISTKKLPPTCLKLREIYKNFAFARSDCTSACSTRAWYPRSSKRCVFVRNIEEDYESSFLSPLPGTRSKGRWAFRSAHNDVATPIRLENKDRFFPLDRRIEPCVCK